MGLTAQLWASAAITAIQMARPGSYEFRKCKEALEFLKEAFYTEYSNVVERINGTVTSRDASQPHNDCDTFVKWVDAHNKMMAARRRID